MEIRINKLTIDNFKGIHHAELTFDGASCEIAGDNGTGKSTVFDAFTWLLFGKDHRGQAATGASGFDITPIDPATREPIHRADTSVEAELTLDRNTTKTLRRVWKEDWVKPKGQAEAVLSGHSGSFWSDGVELPTKKDYDGIIRQLVDENVFKAITDPLYLIGGQTHWKELRGMLLDIVAGEIDRGRLEIEFSDLLAEMNGEPLEQFRKRTAAAKKKCRDVLAQSEPTVRGMMRARPEAEDFDALRSELSSEEERIRQECAPAEERMAEIDRLLEGEKTRADAVREHIAGLYGLQTEIRMKQEDMLAEARRKVAAENNRRGAEIAEREMAVTRAKNTLARYDAEADVRGKQERIAALDDGICKASEQVRDLRDKYTQEREKAMDINVGTTCPACGQELPAETIEEARRKAYAMAVEKKRSDLQKIVDLANEKKAWIERAKSEVETLKSDIEEKAAGREALRQAVESAEAARIGVSSTPTVNPSSEEEKCRKSPEFAELVRQEHEVNSKLLDARSAVADEALNSRLLTERRSLENRVREIVDAGYARMADLKARIAREAEIKRIDAAIEKERSDARAMADELARLEQLEFRTEEYVRADIGLVEDVVNNRFRVARFRMFDQTQEGGLIETCYVTDAKGVPFRSMNDAQRILCGLDVVRVLGEHYGVSAPIFVDNAESVTTRDFGTESQVIALTVTKGAASLQVSTIQ